MRTSVIVGAGLLATPFVVVGAVVVGTMSVAAGSSVETVAPSFQPSSLRPCRSASILDPLHVVPHNTPTGGGFGLRP